MKQSKPIKNKVLKLARSPMCSSKVHLDKKKQSKKTGDFK
jgi:hypothetical protein